MEKYKSHEVRTVKCQKCGELLLRLYPWAYVERSASMEIKILCGRCSNKVIEKQAKEARKRTLKKK